MTRVEKINEFLVNYKREHIYLFNGNLGNHMQLFNTAGLDEGREPIFEADGVEILTYCYDYFDVLGLTEDEYTELAIIAPNGYIPTWAVNEEY